MGMDEAIARSQDAYRHNARFTAVDNRNSPWQRSVSLAAYVDQMYSYTFGVLWEVICYVEPVA